MTWSEVLSRVPVPAIADVFNGQLVRLSEIAEIIDSAENGPSKSETLAAATPEQRENYAALVAFVKDAYADIFESVHGVKFGGAKDEGLIAEAKDTYKALLAGCRFCETSLGMVGFTNELLAVTPKPEGAGIRNYLRSADPNYVPQRRS